MAPLTFAYATRIGLDGIISEWASKRALELRQETWATLWDSLRDAIFARHGIEVCEIGTTWQPTLVGMNALRLFQANEVAYIGGEKAFAPSVNVPKSEIVGTVGAGDAFYAGMLFGLHEDWPLDQCLALANASAATSLHSATTSASIRPLKDCLAYAAEKGLRPT